jgi:25S rRNA (uracil2634-N3)-methyltransferase
MSKNKTKRARRELKRDGARKIVAHHKKVAKATAPSKPAANSKPAVKKHKMASQPATKASVQASQQHDVPFGEYEHILLVGEGDFSFTRSLAINHGCANVVATSYDSLAEVQEKYPTFEAVQTQLNQLTPPVPLHYDIDATKLSSYKHLRCTRDNDDEEESEGWDTIAFMFPHTGGLSTDVNRQVRANQALLVSFFKSCLETSTSAQRLRILSSQRRSTRPPYAPTALHPPFLRLGGRIIVSLFEGEPYTLWNIRDLARHAGLKVVESWKFDWEQYPGYSHVRTLGAMETGWKGEDRDARMYVFEKVDLVADSDEEAELEKMGLSGKRKRKEGVEGKRKKGRGRESEDEEG